MAADREVYLSVGGEEAGSNAASLTGGRKSRIGATGRTGLKVLTEGNGTRLSGQADFRGDIGRRSPHVARPL